MRQITFTPTFAGWRSAARRVLAAELAPESILWEEKDAAQQSLSIFAEDDLPLKAPPVRTPKAFVALAERVACHRSDNRWALLYRTLWRLTHGEPHLLSIVVDPDVIELNHMDKSVRGDLHKMRAFVRFREISLGEDKWYVAWFEPEHHIVERNTSFFVDRFAAMRWSILTPDCCAHWNTKELSITPGVSRADAPTEDSVEDLWRTYYGAIFNPARVKVKAMESEMPRRYWKNLPEASLIPELLNEAPARVERMRESVPLREESFHLIATPPETEDWNELRSAALSCRSCPLWRNATQTVFGEGPGSAKLMLLGEQPGDAEDLAGRPFIGPAGLLLRNAMKETGADISSVYVTNTVKHFKWEPRGKRRLHQKPDERDVGSCRPWFEAEIRIIQPKVLLCLGATAARAVFGGDIRIQRDRGEPHVTRFASRTIITFHPSALLRARDEKMRSEFYTLFVQDLKTAIELSRESD